MSNGIIGIIPARSGSKRLPRKNLLELGGEPLISWTIRSALGSGVLDDVLVSTDDPVIAETAIRFGASAPWLRPAALATDTATSIDVILHAIDACELVGRQPDAVMLLQPTSPFRGIASIQRAAALFESSGGRPIVSVSPARSHPDWCYRVDAGGAMSAYCTNLAGADRSQDLPAAYELNGAIYIARCADLRRNRTFIDARTQALVMDSPEESLDIDDAWDWQLAELLAPRVAAERRNQ